MKKSQGMASFYRDLLEEEETKHAAAVKAAAKAAAEGKLPPPDQIQAEIPREKALAEEARQINAQLGTEAVLINDDGEVVDKRQLLKGGLNIRPKQKPDPTPTNTSAQSEYEARRAAQRNQVKEREARSRQTRAIEEQYEQTRKRAADEEIEKE